MSTSSTSKTALQMKTTASGRPFLKDMHDLFSAFVNSVNITTNRNIFKSYPNTFMAEDAISTLSHLNFSQTITHPDPEDSSRVVTTTVTTTFSMTKEMARHLCGQFLEAHLIFNAADPTEKAMILRPDGIYGLTTKGNIVYETFLREAESAVLTTTDSAPTTSTELSSMQNIPCTTPSGTLLLLLREGEDDQLILNDSTVESTFKAFAGPTPNYTEKDSSVSTTTAAISKDRLSGSASASGSIKEDGPGLIGIRVKDRQQTFRKVRMAFKGSNAVDWLLANTTALNRFEALSIANQFIQYGYIQQASTDPEKEVEILDSSQVIYQFSDLGKEVAWPNDTQSNVPSTSQATDKKNLGTVRSVGTLSVLAPERSSAVGTSKSTKSIWGSITQLKGSPRVDSEPKSPGKLEPRPPVPPPSLLKEPRDLKANPNGSTTQRLKLILADSELSALFKEFLHSMFCQENLEFYNDVVAFKKEFVKKEKTSKLSAEENSKMILQAIRIYKTYLCPGAEKELNINHTVRRDIVNYMTTVMEHVSPTTGELKIPDADADDGDKREAPKMTSNVFRKIEDHIFHLMASDSIPKFVKTAAFKEKIAENFYPGLSAPPGGPLMSMSTFLESLENEENAGSGAARKRGSVYSASPGDGRKPMSPRAMSPSIRLDSASSLSSGGKESTSITADG